MLKTIKSLPLTLFSREFYSDLVHKWRGIGFSFIIVMLVLNLARPMITSILNQDQTSQYITAFFHDLPALTLKGGQLSIDQKSPYIMTVGPKDSGVHILFDTDHDLASFGDLQQKMTKDKTYVIVTAKEIAFLKDRNGTVQISPLKEHSDTTMTHDDLAAMGKKITVWFLPFLFLSLASMFLITIFFKMLFGAVIALILSLMFKVELSFGGGMRLMAAAAIPETFLSTAFPSIWIPITLALWIGYGMYGLWSARQTQPAA